MCVFIGAITSCLGSPNENAVVTIFLTSFPISNKIKMNNLMLIDIFLGLLDNLYVFGLIILRFSVEKIL